MDASRFQVIYILTKLISDGNPFGLNLKRSIQAFAPNDSKSIQKKAYAVQNETRIQDSYLFLI